MDSKEKRELKAIAGQISWIATQTRPDLAYDACEISTSVKNATVEDVMQANKVIRKAKSNKVRLRFRDLEDVKRAELISFSDASLHLGNLERISIVVFSKTLYLFSIETSNSVDITAPLHAH